MIGNPAVILDQVFDSSPAGMSLTVGPNHTHVKVNKRYQELSGLTKPVLGLTAREALSMLDDQAYFHILDQVFFTGKTHTGKEAALRFRHEDGCTHERYFDFSVQPLFDENGRVYGILTHGFDVTDKVLARLAVETSRRLVENDRENFCNLLKQTPELVCILRGPEHVYEFVNDAHVKAIGFNATGMTVREAHPHSKALHNLLDEIYRSGNLSRVHESPIQLDGRIRYFNITYAARRNMNDVIDGILALGMEVTEDVVWRQTLETSETRFKRLANSMPQIVYVSNPDGSVKFLNERWREYTGKYDEVMNERVTADIIHPDDLPLTTESWEKAAREGSRFDIKIRLRNGLGEHRWFITRAVPHYVSNEIKEWIGTSTDIHDQVLIADELIRSREHYRIVFEDSPVPMWIMDPDSGRLIDVNNVALRTYDCTRHEFLRMKAEELMPPEDREAFDRMMREASLTPNRSLQSQARHLRKDGSVIHMEVTMRDLILDGRLQRMAAMVDITRRIAVEEQLRQLMQKLQAAKEEAEHANRLKSAFLANMSHEIRTPLGAMLGFADLLRDQNLTQAEHANFLSTLVRNGEQLSVIINDILDLSKVEAGHLSLEFIRIDATAIVRDVLSLMELTAREKKLCLSYDADPSTPQQLTSDPVRVRQVLLNLVSNAIKFTAQGEVCIRSHGECDAQGRMQAVFEISDTGIGIAADQHERIFEMFVQADDSITRKFGGTGLGLSLSRKLARALGGDVHVLHSEPGRGSVFRFMFQDRPEQGNQDTTSRLTSTPAGTGESVSLEGLKILVVDDAPDIRSLIAFLLTRAGAEVDFAENGMEACQKALGSGHDLVLMDIQMPLMDGYAATMKLRNQGYIKPIIALTAHAMTEARRKCISVGCNGHLPKPIVPAHLLEVVTMHARPV